MKNVTITLSDDLASRVRLAAAREGKSLSKFIAEHLSRALGGHTDPLIPFDRWLAGPGWDAGAGDPPTREDIHDRPVLRGYERADLPARPQRGAEARADEA
ncbi:ribbon-helix-helix protein, CopG family [Azorhizobium doebereinerae]|uniref:ribbon-helix-helix protein, CopG family n=1 Tax=Azorhizobium doebereinerae TaxID=281091 RepID=UPI000415902D|nr:ribbon-helix-helix protein, CopG family [Azorhizobium doebereinerae]